MAVTLELMNVCQVQIPKEAKLEVLYHNNIYSVYLTGSVSENQPKDKERPRLALKPRTLPLPNQATGPTSVDGENSADDGQPQQTEQFTTTNRPRAVASTAEVFGGAKPVDTSAREREVEEKLKREQEEFRRHDEERKLQREHVRKTSSSNAPPEYDF